MAIPKILDHERKLKNIQDGTGALSIKQSGATASGYASHAEGSQTTASGYVSHAEGSQTTANGAYSHAEGEYSQAIGRSSHAEGQSTASGLHSHAEGQNSQANGEASHVEGLMSQANGYASHAEGNAYANGEYSHAEGMGAKADGNCSHAEGEGTTANSQSQHVQGEYNILDTENLSGRGTYAHIVGNGTGSTHSNAHTLDWSGNAWFAGDVYVGSESGTNKDDGSKKLATEEYVDNNGGIFWATSTTTFDELQDAWNMGKYLCIPPIGSGLDVSCTYICDGMINYDSENDRMFAFCPASPSSVMHMVGGGYYLYFSQANGWLSLEPSIFTRGTIANVYVPLQRESMSQPAPLSASDAYYRPIYTSTREPTASDGKVGDIWIVYTE